LTHFSFWLARADEGRCAPNELPPLHSIPLQLEDDGMQATTSSAVAARALSLSRALFNYDARLVVVAA
jgi:hypothetical protein